MKQASFKLTRSKTTKTKQRLNIFATKGCYYLNFAFYLSIAEQRLKVKRENEWLRKWHKIAQLIYLAM